MTITIKSQELDVVFNHIFDLMQNVKPATETLSSLKNVLTKYGVFEFDEEKMLEHCLSKMDSMVGDFEANMRDMLIYSSYIAIFLQELEDEGLINVEDEELQDEEEGKEFDDTEVIGSDNQNLASAK